MMTMTRRILWQSRHPALPRQEAELRRLFGEVEIVQSPRPFDSAEQIKATYQQGHYDDIVVVAPLAVLAKLVDLGLHPLWAQMDEVPLDQAEVRARDRGYRFNRFLRVKGLKIELDELE